MMQVRSVLTCRCRDGVCAKCYGTLLTAGRLRWANPNIIAAQSIGEPEQHHAHLPHRQRIPHLKILHRVYPVLKSYLKPATKA